MQRRPWAAVQCEFRESSVNETTDNQVQFAEDFTHPIPSAQEPDILSEEANSNPYSPPRAVVADFQPGAAAQVRPGTVNLAVRLLWIACGLGALFILFKPLTLRPGTSALWVRLISFLFFAPFAWLNFKIAARRNWARITFVVIAIVGTMFYLIQPEKVIRLSWPDKVNFMVQTGLQLATFVLLLLPSARRWFKPPSSPA